MSTSDGAARVSGADPAPEWGVPVHGVPVHGVPVHKVLNNNVAVALDESGRERVLMGRGLAFGLKPDDIIDPAKVE